MNSLKCNTKYVEEYNGIDKVPDNDLRKIRYNKIFNYIYCFPFLVFFW